MTHRVGLIGSGWIAPFHVDENDEGLDLAPEIEDFFECVETGRRPETDGYMARKIIELVLDAYRRAEAEGGNV